MLKLLPVTILLLVEALATHGQGFNRRYDLLDKKLSQTGYGIELISEGYVLISTSSDYDSLAPDLYFHHKSVILTAIDHEGERLWEKRAKRAQHSAFAGWANCCDTIPGGGFVSSGTSENVEGMGEIFLIRFDAYGDTLWTSVFGDPALNKYWSGRQVKHTPDGGFLIVGITDQIGLRNGFALKTDSLGNEEWRKIYPWTTNQSEGLSACDVGPAGSFYMSGARFLTAQHARPWVQRTTAQGDTLWRVSWGEQFMDGPGHVTTLSDGQPVIAYWKEYSHEQIPMSRPALAKLDSSNGAIIWDRVYGEITSTTGIYTVKETPTGSLIACGITYADGGYKGLLLHTDANGDSLWMRSYFYQDSLMLDGMGRFFDVLPTPEGGFITTGVVWGPISSPNPPGYTQDTWVVKVDAQGCIVPGCNIVGIQEQATNLLEALRIWPNPARQGEPIHISLDLPESLNGRQLELTMVAMDGKVVHRQGLPLSTGEGPGVRLQLSHLVPGLYHLHISAGTTWYTGGKLVVE
jgi:hypothetical protein